MKDKKEELEGLLIALDNLKETMTHDIDELSTRVENALKETNKEQKSTIRVIPFDIEKAKQGAKVITRDGHNVRILCYHSRYANGTQPIVAEIDKIEDVTLTTHAEDGTYLFNKSKSDYDLMIAEGCV